MVREERRRLYCLFGLPGTPSDDRPNRKVGRTPGTNKDIVLADARHRPWFLDLPEAAAVAVSEATPTPSASISSFVVTNQNRASLHDLRRPIENARGQAKGEKPDQLHKNAASAHLA